MAIKRQSREIVVISCRVQRREASEGRRMKIEKEKVCTVGDLKKGMLQYAAIRV